MSDELQLAFRALADPTRREILALLSRKDMSIGQVSDHFEMTRAAVKKHLVMLSDGGLIATQTRGRTRINTLNAAGLKPVVDWLSYFEAFWDDKLSALQTVIEQKETD